METVMTKIKPIQHTEHFFQLGTPFFPVYLSLGKEAMLIEGGTGGELSLVKEQIKELGVDFEKIKYITLTHSHADHIGLVPHLAQEWGHFKLCANKKVSDALKNENVIKEFINMDNFIAERLKSIGEISDLPPKLDNYVFNVDTFIEEGDKLDLGSGINWKVLNIAGHSPCQIALYEEKEGTLVVGDGAGLYFPKIDDFWPEYFLSLEQYCSGLHRLSEFKGNRVALSHFGVVEGDSKAFLKKSLKATEAYHNEMIKRTGNGEDNNSVALEKTKWVLSNHNYMTFELTEQMARLLIKRSQKDADKAGLFAGL
jgi:glyoxylase-like metal-dependent hydrolase (beta-lactamase superfamily II)